LAPADQLLDGNVGKVEQRAVGTLFLQHLFFCGVTLILLAMNQHNRR
jgi:hypothetical protein